MEYGGTGVVTRQGQVTLPKKARDSLKLALGSMLEFFYDSNVVVIKRRSPPAEVFERVSSAAEQRFAQRGITPADVENEVKAARKAKRNR